MWRGVKIYKSTNGEWEDFSNVYEVSDKGDIRLISSHKVLVAKKYKGYRYVELESDGSVLKRKVHTIVASTYPDICGEVNEVVNHKNWDKSDNRAYNLEWCSNSYNLKYGGNPCKDCTPEKRLYSICKDILKEKKKKIGKKSFRENKNDFKLVLGDYIFRFDKNENLISAISKNGSDDLLKKPKIKDISKMDMSEYLSYVEEIFMKKWEYYDGDR